MRITVRVPATSANLGPGFDCFGLALDLCNEVILDSGAEPGVVWEGEGAGELPTDGTDMISRMIARVASMHDLTVPPIRLLGRNRIPLERGLGSSAAAATAGVVLGARLFDLEVDLSEVFALVAKVEGHPDNAAPAVFGGFTIALPDGLVRRFDPHPGLRPVVLVPEDDRLPTAQARRALPDEVPLQDAVFNAAHAALMVEAITRAPWLLHRAMRDRLHQDARLALVPGVLEVFRSVAAQHVPVCVSGAGPSLLAFELDPTPVSDPGAGWRVLRPAVRSAGAEVVLD